MSRLYTVHEAAKLIPIHPETVKAWVIKGAINAKTIGDELLIPESEVEKAKEILKIGRSERMRQEAHRQNISHLYKLCSHDQFEEVSAELDLSEPPQNVRECYAIVKRVLKKDVGQGGKVNQ